MVSVELVTLSDGYVRLDPEASDPGVHYWRVRRLSSGGDLGALRLSVIDAQSAPRRARLDIDVSPDADTGTIHSLAQATTLACRWSFSAISVSVITWLGPTDPTTRAIVFEAGFRVHPLPHRGALDGPDGPCDAWFADLTPADTRAVVHRSMTAREQHVLTAMARGRSNVEIARELGISENTVKNHVRSILELLQAPSRTAAVVTALRAGWVSLEWDTG